MRGSRAAMIFQESMTSLNPAFTVGDQIAETMRRHLGLGRAEAHRRAVDMLARVHIPNAAGAPVRTRTSSPLACGNG